MEPFKPNRGPLKLSENMIIENLAKVLDIATETVDSIADVSSDEQHTEPPNEWRTWTADEAQEAFGVLSPHGLLVVARSLLGIIVMLCI